MIDRTQTVTPPAKQGTSAFLVKQTGKAVQQTPAVNLTFTR